MDLETELQLEAKISRNLNFKLDKVARQCPGVPNLHPNYGVRIIHFTYNQSVNQLYTASKIVNESEAQEICLRGIENK